MDINKLSGAKLDCKVAEAEGLKWVLHRFADTGGLSCQIIDNIASKAFRQMIYTPYHPSSDLDAAEAIINRELIAICFRVSDWYAEMNVGSKNFFSASGETPLEAAMRCYVASKK